MTTKLIEKVKRGIRTASKAAGGLVVIAALNGCISSTYKSLAYIEADRGNFDTAAKAYAVGDVMQSLEQYDNHEQTMAAIRESQQPRQNQQNQRQSQVRQETRRNPLYDKVNNMMEPAKRDGIGLFLWEDTNNNGEIELDADRFPPADKFYSGDVLVFFAKILPNTTNNTIQLRDFSENKIFVLNEDKDKKSSEATFIPGNIGVNELITYYETAPFGVKEFDIEVVNEKEEILSVKKFKIDFRSRK